MEKFPGGGGGGGGRSSGEGALLAVCVLLWFVWLCLSQIFVASQFCSSAFILHLSADFPSLTK